MKTYVHICEESDWVKNPQITLVTLGIPSHSSLTSPMPFVNV
jgi:hypothetical protein